MKSKFIAYFFWLIAFFGVLGFQRFYLGKKVTGYIWLFTLGLFGIGAIYDFFTLGNQVETYNDVNSNGINITVNVPRY